MDFNNLIAIFPADINLEFFFRIPLTTLREVLGVETLREERIRRLHCIVSRNWSNSLVLEGEIDNDNQPTFLILSPLLEVERRIDNLVGNDEFVRLGGSSRVLICLILSVLVNDLTEVGVCLVNPVFLDDVLVLPAPLIAPIDDQDGIPDIVSFTFIENSDSYKILHISQEGDTNIEIFRSQTNSWYLISPQWPCMVKGHICLMNELEDPLVLSEREVHFIVHNVAHFLVWGNDGYGSFAVGVVGFDFESETFILLREFDHPIRPNGEPQIGIFHGNVAVREINEGVQEYHIVEELQQPWTPAVSLFTDAPQLVGLFELPVELNIIVHYAETLNRIM